MKYIILILALGICSAQQQQTVDLDKVQLNYRLMVDQENEIVKQLCIMLAQTNAQLQLVTKQKDSLSALVPSKTSKKEKELAQMQAELERLKKEQKKYELPEAVK